MKRFPIETSSHGWGIIPCKLRYLQERGIPSAVAIANCKEMRYTTHGKRYFAVAFGNEGGGYEIRNPFFKGCVPPKDVTLLPVGSAGYLLSRVWGVGRTPSPSSCAGHRRQGRPPRAQLGVQRGEGVPPSGRLRADKVLP